MSKIIFKNVTLDEVAEEDQKSVLEFLKNKFSIEDVRILEGEPVFSLNIEKIGQSKTTTSILFECSYDCDDKMLPELTIADSSCPTEDGRLHLFLFNAMDNEGHDSDKITEDEEKEIIEFFKGKFKYHHVRSIYESFDDYSRAIFFNNSKIEEIDGDDDDITVILEDGNEFFIIAEDIIDNESDLGIPKKMIDYIRLQLLQMFRP